VEAFSPAAVLKTIHEEKCTAFHGVPTMFIAMMEHADFGKTDFSHMRTGIMAGSPCPVKVMRQVVEQMNMPEITIVYGLTEASPGCTQTTTDDSLELRVSTVGRNLPFVETKVVDPETGEDCPPGVPGEFMARGYNIMKGYYKMPEATAAAITPDGWLHTGDLASADEKGYYKITVRIKDMIIRGGENIYPKEIEECFYTNPDIQDVQVVGIPSEAYGEEVMAYIILKPGAAMTEDEAKEFVRQRIARHKVPKYVAFIEEFPMTASGKIQKYKLRDMAVDKLKLHDAANIETA
jgi:fatty-acyl-CoA synthase